MFRHRQDDPGFAVQQKTFCTFLLKFVCHQTKTPRLFFLDLPGSQRAVPCGRLLKTQNLSCANWGGKTKTRKTKKARSREGDLSDDLKLRELFFPGEAS